MFVVKHEEIMFIGGPRHRQKYNTKMDLAEIGYGSGN
jgi:hypothetical protein